MVVVQLLVVFERDLDLAGCGGRVRRDVGVDAFDEVGVLGCDATHATPGVLMGARHAVTQQRPHLRRHETGLVRPILDETTWRAVPKRVQVAVRIRAEAAEEGEVVAAREDVDAVDLHDLQARGGRRQVACRDALGACLREPLGGQRDAACLRGAEASRTAVRHVADSSGRPRQPRRLGVFRPRDGVATRRRPGSTRHLTGGAEGLE